MKHKGWAGPARWLRARLSYCCWRARCWPARQDTDISRYVIGGGGGHSEAGAFVLDATAGQAVTGAVNAGRFGLCAGFWCGMGEYRVRLRSSCTANTNAWGGMYID